MCLADRQRFFRFLLQGVGLLRIAMSIASAPFAGPFESRPPSHQMHIVQRSSPSRSSDCDRCCMERSLKRARHDLNPSRQSLGKGAASGHVGCGAAARVRPGAVHFPSRSIGIVRYCLCRSHASPPAAGCLSGQQRHAGFPHARHRHKNLAITDSQEVRR